MHSNVPSYREHPSNQQSINVRVFHHRLVCFTPLSPCRSNSAGHLSRFVIGCVTRASCTRWCHHISSRSDCPADTAPRKITSIATAIVPCQLLLIAILDVALWWLCQCMHNMSLRCGNSHVVRDHRIESSSSSSCHAEHSTSLAQLQMLDLHCFISTFAAPRVWSWSPFIWIATHHPAGGTKASTVLRQKLSRDSRSNITIASCNAPRGRESWVSMFMAWSLQAVHGIRCKKWGVDAMVVFEKNLRKTHSHNSRNNKSKRITPSTYLFFKECSTPLRLSVVA